MEDNPLFKFLRENKILSPEQISKMSEEDEKTTRDNIHLEDAAKFNHKILNNISSDLNSTNITDQALPAEVEEMLKANKTEKWKYVILEELGLGGSSTVYKAYDLSLKRYVAIKFLNMPSSETINRFQNEAETIAKLDHFNIVPLYEIGQYSGKYYMVLKYLPGMTLEKSKTPIEINFALSIIKSVCDALQYAHTKGVIHRDIKPHNILLSDNKTFVLDFGIAKLQDSLLTSTKDTLGTPNYMSPEQAEGMQVDQRTDIYSTGASLYYLLTGHHPFNGGTVLEVIKNVIDKEPIPVNKINPHVKNSLKLIIHKSMSKDPNLRYENIGEFKSDIEKYLNNEPISARPLSVAYKTKILVTKHYLFLIFLLAISIITAFLIKSSINFTKNEMYTTRQAATPDYDKGFNLLKIAKFSTVKNKRFQITEHLKQSISFFTKAIELDSTFSESYYSRGESHFRLGNYDLAKNDFTTATKINPNLSDAYYMKIISMLFLFTSSPMTLYSIDQDLLVIPNLKKDRDDLKKLNVLPSKIYCADAIICYLEKDTEKALEYLDKAIADDPVSSYTYLFRTAIWFDKSKTAAAENDKNKLKEFAKRGKKDAESALLIDPNYLPNYYILSNFNMVLGRYKDAIETLSEAKEITPDNYMITYFETMAHLNFGYKDLAIQTVKQLDQKMPTNNESTNLIKFYLCRGYMRLSVGFTTEAESDFQFAIKSAPDTIRDIIIEKVNKIKNTKDH
ncbi:MAG: protein kinase [Planctomycetes bacterium]|nr:protein kinase [Planctomycetota bacterium]